MTLTYPEEIIGQIEHKVREAHMYQLHVMFKVTLFYVRVLDHCSKRIKIGILCDFIHQML